MRTPEMTPTEINQFSRRLNSLSSGEKGQPYLAGKMAARRGTYDQFVRQQLGDHPYGRILIDGMHEATSLLRERINFHLLRLLSPTRSQVEQAFAQAFIDIAPQYYKNPDSRRAPTIVKQLGVESNNVLVWWTFAPYLYDELIRCGQKTVQAIVNLCEWMLQAPTTDVNHNVVTLPGVDWLENDQLFVLEDHVQQVDGTPRIIRKGFVKKITGDNVKVTQEDMGEYITVPISDARPLNGGSNLAEGTPVVLLKDGQLPISASHLLARDLAAALVSQWLLRHNIR